MCELFPHPVVSSLGKHFLAGSKDGYIQEFLSMGVWYTFVLGCGIKGHVPKNGLI